MQFTHPPPINPQIKHHQRMRYVVLASNSLDVTFANVLDGIIVATTTTNAVQLFDQVRIHGVEVWAVGTGTAPTTVQCTFSGNVLGASGNARVYSDTSVSIQPAHILARPDPLSQTAQWQPYNTNTAFRLNVPAGAIVDVIVSYRNDDSAPTGTAAVVAATAGEVYYRGLDSLAIATTNYVPQALLTR